GLPVKGCRGERHQPGKDKAPDGAVVHEPEPTETAHDIAVRKQRKLNDLARRYNKWQTFVGGVLTAKALREHAFCFVSAISFRLACCARRAVDRPERLDGSSPCLRMDQRTAARSGRSASMVACTGAHVRPRSWRHFARGATRTARASL